MLQPPNPSMGASREAGQRSGTHVLGTLSIALGLAWSLAFVVVAVRYQLQMYADGSIFSYAVAVRDSWAFHFHNISGRTFVWLAAMLPAELYGRLARDAAGAIVLYGILFYVAQLVGLGMTWLADRSTGRLLFGFACASTAVLCPVVFAVPTELWMAHALFWPTLAVCHYSRGIAGMLLSFALLALLLLTHEGGVIFAVVILATLALRGLRDPALVRSTLAFVPALAIWAAMKLFIPPDDYIASVLARHALYLIDIRRPFEEPVFVLALAALAGYGLMFLALRRLVPARAHVLAVVIVAIILAIYWLWFDHALLTQGRYHLRTLLLGGTPALGVLASFYALDRDGNLNLRLPALSRGLMAISGGAAAQATVGALVLVTLIHAVETAKFVTAWSRYKDAVRALATGTASDPQLGSPLFVSAQRIGPDLNRLNWNSTTPYLSIILAPAFAPNRLVIDPEANYFWLSCETATDNEQASRGVPAASRELVRLLACLHR